MKQITREELKRMMDSSESFVLIDARKHDSYNKEHLPGAKSIPSDHLGVHMMKNEDKESTYVTYCTDIECESSTIAAKKLESYGFRKVLEFKGGIRDWKDAGYPTEKE